MKEEKNLIKRASIGPTELMHAMEEDTSYFRFFSEKTPFLFSHKIILNII